MSYVTAKLFLVELLMCRQIHQRQRQ